MSCSRAWTEAASTSARAPPPRLAIPCCLALLMAAALQANPAAGQDYSTATLVRFNTQCARCHEGECSGRLSFALGDEATYSHLRRYLAEPGQPVEDLEPYVRLLERMKLECRLPAFPVTPGRRWDAGQLEPLRNALAHAYFIPIGPLPAGDYRVALRTDQLCRIQADMVSPVFDFEEASGVTSLAGEVELRFRLPSEAVYYLRLYTDRPATLLAVEVQPTPGSAP